MLCFAVLRCAVLPEAKPQAMFMSATLRMQYDFLAVFSSLLPLAVLDLALWRVCFGNINPAIIVH